MQANPRKKVTEIHARLEIVSDAVQAGRVLDEIAWTNIRNDLRKLYDSGPDRAEVALELAAAETCGPTQLKRLVG